MFDHIAAKQIFGIPIRKRGDKEEVLHVPKDTTNPIDIKLRQIAMLGDNQTDIYTEFFDKWVAVARADGKGIFVGRIKDVYPSRDLLVKNRKDEMAIVPFGNVIQISEREL
jgi:hypothetical protein